jgi:hypothetical protein
MSAKRIALDRRSNNTYASLKSESLMRTETDASGVLQDIDDLANTRE